MPTYTANPFSTLKLGPITLRNRFIRAGANEAMSLDGVPTRALVKHHRDMARGGVALTTVAYGAVSERGRTLPNQIWLRPEIVPDLKVLTDAVHAEGGKISMQLTHGGSFITSIKVKGRTISASGGINKAGLLCGNFLQRAMNESDMAEVVCDFVRAAELCREAGFDAVELHMGHGYLLNQFISPLSNKRKDEYGGSAENRVRFPAQVLKAVKRAVGTDIAVLAKINVADGVRKGSTVEDGIVTGRALQEAGADMLILSGGRNIESGWFMFGSNMNMEEMSKVLAGQKLTLAMIKLSQKGVPKVKFRPMYFLDYSRRIRAELDIPLGYLGGASSMADVGQAMAEGFEAVVMARPLLHDPELVRKFQQGLISKSGCTYCNGCVPYIYDPAGTRCIENPPNDLALNQQRARLDVSATS
ncbi:2,4-dienoyl-CoA reductase-like NADH-dependent reductase (Old Yellow Enzyme family) [Marinobacterium halophilum]|uniref:2,4-dienoyl-CoA reductase-like NADH-dependent reductase (Old Yellow Enzyme family) n=1 Tax=Marinobacterium halophilum TaxID=267374 RepID=A0A2P8F2D9_9GAMM|nr:NADH:flavin oxidoreductase [Marinobacterium halophilum]PSL15882.1 2,4-dienoyl-CoA reductase-like NADH-dependent reductase (Old Yellow Enzyme family) [Marinobacterium halophilum]